MSSYMIWVDVKDGGVVQRTPGGILAFENKRGAFWPACDGGSDVSGECTSIFLKIAWEDWLWCWEVVTLDYIITFLLFLLLYCHMSLLSFGTICHPFLYMLEMPVIQ